MPAVTEPELIDFSSPIGGFERPLAIVEACHERLRRMVEMLVPLREHLREHGADQRAVVSAGTIRCYLEEAWPRHMQDEEIDLIPRIRARLHDRHTAGSESLAETIEIVTEQHEAFGPLFRQVLPLLRAVESKTAQRLDDPAVQSFVELFRVHMALEEDVLAPAYSKMLSAEDLRQIGTSMAARRGVVWPPREGGTPR